MAITHQYMWFITGYVSLPTFNRSSSLLGYLPAPSSPAARAASAWSSRSSSSNCPRTSSSGLYETQRRPARFSLQALKETARSTLEVIQLDVDDTNGIERSVEEVTAILGDRTLDYLVNNAAIVSLIFFSLSPFLSLSLFVSSSRPLMG